MPSRKSKPASNASRLNCSNAAAPNLGRLLEKLELLEADDDALAGALLELKEALGKHHDERLARWRASGASFRRRDKDPKAAAPRPRDGLAQPDADAPRN
jgi:Conjugal transfer protein TraD